MDTPHLVPIARAADIAEGMILRVADTPAGPLATTRAATARSAASS